MRHDLKSNIKAYFSGFTDTFVRDGDGMTGGRRIVLTTTLLTTLYTNLVEGIFLTGMLLDAGADSIYINYIAIMLSACSFVQLAAPFLWEKMERRKRLLIAMRAVYHFLNVIALGGVFLLPLKKETLLALVMGIVIARNLINSFSTPGLSIWQMQSIPDGYRNEFFAVRNILSCIIGALSVFLASRMADTFEAETISFGGMSPILSANIIMRSVGVVLAVLDIVLLCRLKEYPYAKPKEGEGRGLRLLIVPLKDGLFQRTVVSSLLYAFFTALVGNFFNVYVLDIAHMSYTYLSLGSVVSIPLILVMTPVWSYLIRRFGWTRILPIAYFTYAFPIGINAWVTETTQYCYLIVMISVYLFQPGLSIIHAYLPYINMPDTFRTAYISYYSIASAVAVLLGNFVGTLFMRVTRDLTLDLFGLPMTNYQYINLLMAALIMLLAVGTVFLLRNIPQRNASAGS